MVSVKESFVNRAPVTQITRYHALASRFLQRQFMHACVCSMISCYLCSYIIGRHHNLGALFPWSWTGPRATVLFLGVFPVALTRKANLRVISLQGRNDLMTCYLRIFSHAFPRALIAYLLGAWLITSVYIRNSSHASGFSLLITLKSYELPRLNERYLYLQVFSIYWGFVAAVYHIMQEVDLLVIPFNRTKIDPRQQLKRAIVLAAQNAAVSAVILSLTAPFIYIILRQSLYRAALSLVRLLYPMPKYNGTLAWPVDASILISTAMLSFLGSYLWFLLNAVFSIYLSKAPLRKGRLISERARQSNESLLTGLADSSRPLTQFLALYELLIISEEQKYRSRRVKYYEAGSPEAVQWMTIREACLGVLSTTALPLKIRLGERTGTESASEPASHASNVPSTAPVKVVHANILRHSGPQNNALEKNLEKLKSDSQSVEQNQNQIASAYNSTEHFYQQVQMWLHQQKKIVVTLLPSQVQAFLQPSPNEVLAPASLQMLAVLCLKNLLSRSIEEDTFGRVHKDIETVLNKFMELHSLLERFCKEQPRFTEAQNQVLKAIENTVKHAIADLGFVFEEYVDFNPSIRSFLSSVRQESS